MTDNVIKKIIIGVVIIGCVSLLLVGSLFFRKKGSTGSDAGKNKEESSDTGKKREEIDEKRLAELKLDPTGSYYLNTSAEDGLTVCVWKQITGYEQENGKIFCGLLPGQLDKIYNPEPTKDMASMGLGLGGFTPEDMKIILSTFDIPKESISVITWSNPADSVGLCTRPTATEVNEVRASLLGEK